MSETNFPITDLLRRKLQTSFVVTSITLCVASTLFLLLFGDRLGFGISSMAEGRMTAGFSQVFSRFVLFIAVLIFVVGAVIISFMVFVMMSQRVRDIGLMRAVGCPNDLIFGYFMNELLIVTVVGCVLGVVFGILADFTSVHLLSGLGFQISQTAVNLWLVLLVFIVFFALALIFGAKPILDATKVEPARALSPTYYFGLSKESGFRVISKSAPTIKIALRSLFRRKSATIRIVLCLSTVFILVTVAVAGGLIANQTTESWVEKAIGQDMVLIAHQEMVSQYRLLQSKFYEANESSNFNYTNKKYAIPEEMQNQLKNIVGVDIDSRLILEAQVREVPGFILGEQTGETTTVGDSHVGTSLIVGVEPESVLADWFLDGRFLAENDSQEAVVGDTVAQKMFSMPLNQSISLFNNNLDIVGVCVDPIDNGNVTYVPLKTLMSISGVSAPNIIMVRINSSADRTDVLNQIGTVVSAYQGFEVYELNEVLDKNLGFLNYMWSTIMFMPLSALAAASLCLIGYVMLAINEQHQEFGVLRALGAKPKTVITIVSAQNLVVLLSSFAVGITFGIMITLLILVPEPVVTGYILMEIAGWLLTALAVTFIFSLYPAIRFAKKPIIEITA